MLTDTFFSVTLALLAAFGLWALVRIFVLAWLLPQNLSITLTFATNEDAARAPQLLHAARAQFIFCGKVGITALLLGGQADNEALVQFLESEGVACFGVDAP